MDIAATFDEEPFRHSDPRYKTCCGMHVKTACKLIAILSAIKVIILLLLLIFAYESFSMSMWIFRLVVAILFAVATFLLFWAIKKENEKLLLPYIGFLALCVIFCIILTLFSLWSLIDPHSEPAKFGINYVTGDNSTHMEHLGIRDDDTAVRVSSALVVVLALVGVAVCVWFILIIYKYFVYLVNMKRARNPKNVVHHENHENHEITELKNGKNGTQ